MGRVRESVDKALRFSYVAEAICVAVIALVLLAVLIGRAIYLAR